MTRKDFFRGTDQRQLVKYHGKFTMVDFSDWRLQGQEKYLKGAELRRQEYRRYPKNPTWDHDHCSFCWAEFAVENDPDVLHEGYCTLDEYHWICSKCFDDFKDLFNWRLVSSPGC